MSGVEMSQELTDVLVAVAPGSGRVARRATSLLFDPSGENGDLINRFDQAVDDAAAITAVKQQLIDVEFAAAPLVLIDWRTGGLGLIVFGDTDVHSSAAAAPMISGAGSGTWIERHLGSLELGDAAEAEVWCGDETDNATDLRLGVVRCGGVRLAVKRGGAAPILDTSVVETAVVDSDSLPAPGARAGHLTPPPAPSPSDSAAADVAAPVQAGFVADPSGLEWTDTEPQTAASTVPADPFSDAVASDPPMDVPLTQPAGEIEGLNEAIESAGVGLVEATVCENGHGNPPRYAICRSCAVEIDPDSAVSLIAQPAVGCLRFVDGGVVEMDATFVMGRKPAVDDASSKTFTIDHAEVSRSHLEVKVEGWAVLATDLGSRNGTWVIPPNDPTPIKLDPQVPYLLEHGTTVHLGGPEASFTYDFGSD